MDRLAGRGVFGQEEIPNLAKKIPQESGEFFIPYLAKCDMNPEDGRPPRLPSGAGFTDGGVSGCASGARADRHSADDRVTPLPPGGINSRGAPNSPRAQTPVRVSGAPPPRLRTRLGRNGHNRPFPSGVTPGGRAASLPATETSRPKSCTSSPSGDSHHSGGGHGPEPPISRSRAARPSSAAAKAPIV